MFFEQIDPIRLPMKLLPSFLVAGVLTCLALLPPSLSAATVTWVAGNGDWSVPGNWSTGVLPGSGDAVVIPAGTAITVTHSTGTDSISNLTSQQAFVLSGGSLTVATTVQVNKTFTMSGGTLVGANVLQGTNGAGVTVSSGTMNGVTLNCSLDAGNSYSGANLTVLGGLTVNGTILLGNPDNGNYGALSFAASETLGGTATVVFGQSGCNTLSVSAAGDVLTIGPNVNIQGQAGQIGYAPSCFGGPQNVSVINQGTIMASVTGGTIAISGASFANSGSVSITNGGSISINNFASVTGLTGGGGGTISLGGSYTIVSPLTVDNSKLSLGGTWTNTSSILTSNSTVYLGGTFATTNLGTFAPTNCTVYLSGVVDNTNATLKINSQPWILFQGDVLGGTIVTTNGASLIANSSGTLDGVTLNGTLDAGNSINGGWLNILDGLTLNGTALVGNPSNNWSGYINFPETESLTGNATVEFGNSGACNALRLTTASTTLTLGPNVLVEGTSGQVGSSVQLLLRRTPKCFPDQPGDHLRECQWWNDLCLWLARRQFRLLNPNQRRQSEHQLPAGRDRFVRQFGRHFDPQRQL